MENQEGRLEKGVLLSFFKYLCYSMKYTDNILSDSASRMADKEEERMECIYVSNLVRDRIWPDFTAHFQSESTKGSYSSDIVEIMNYFEKDFLKIHEKEI